VSLQLQGYSSNEKTAALISQNRRVYENERGKEPTQQRFFLFCRRADQ
jgi:hypothetical protein